MSSSERHQFTEMFHLVDRDNNGSITKMELNHLLNILNNRVSSVELDALMSELDENDDGEIDFNEFCLLMTRRVAARFSADQVRRAFAGLSDPNDQKRGLIDLRLIERSLAQLAGSHESKADQEKRIKMTELLSQLSVDYQGKFDYLSFISSSMQEI